MKKIHVFVIVLLIVLADQWLKFYVKTTFPLNTSKPVLGDWFHLYFVENPGMAYGWKFGGNWGKIILTVFRLVAVVFGFFYIGKLIKEKYNNWFIVCASLIFAGALGNLIDSCFYGLIFDKGMIFSSQFNDYYGYDGLAVLSKKGYASFLHGNVVDMLYFPLIHGTFPHWIPVWGGENFEFFRPIFNIADASISGGVISIILFQRFLLKNSPKDSESSIEEITENKIK